MKDAIYLLFDLLNALVKHAASDNRISDHAAL